MPIVHNGLHYDGVRLCGSWRRTGPCCDLFRKPVEGIANKVPTGPATTIGVQFEPPGGPFHRGVLPCQLHRFGRHPGVLVDLEHRGERLICSNEYFVALVPFWAVWPFEALVLCRRPVASLLEMTDAEKNGLSDIVRRLTIRYDNLFQCSFPYSAGLHQAPTDGAAYPEWDFHMHFYPPLLRSATVKKFMVGYEMLATPQRDITAESAAETLRRALNPTSF